ncbi:MAG: radical SAM/SPASM domain-containing protein [Thermoanaerobaculia bacterium]
MSELTEAALRHAADSVRAVPADSAESGVSPYLHRREESIYNPLTDRTLTAGDPLFAALRSFESSGHAPAGEGAQLEAEGWIVADRQTASHSFLLKYVSLEAHTVCNQSCYFCPVSIAPRESHFMPMDLYQRILGQLSDYRSTIEALFMINYNEPTADKRFVEQVRAIRAAGLPPAVLTNGTGLTPDRVDALVEMGGLRFLSINLSTIDRERYKKERGNDHLIGVLRNLEYAKSQPLAEQMDMVVLGTGNDNHKRDFEEITAKFAGSRFTVKYFEVMDRAGYLQIGMKPAAPIGKLCGCDNVGSRPFQHLHITPHAECILCCEDYDEKHVVGDLNHESVAEVLTGPKLSLMRRWVYGVEEAPADFICRGCTFALTRQN